MYWHILVILHLQEQTPHQLAWNGLSYTCANFQMYRREFGRKLGIALERMEVFVSKTVFAFPMLRLPLMKFVDILLLLGFYYPSRLRRISQLLDT